MTTAERTTRILLVEDNPGDARLIREALRSSGSVAFELVHVDRLSAALEEIAREPVDVVLLDLSPPDALGIGTVERMQGHAPELPIVVLAGLDDERLAMHAVQAAAQDYLVKGQVEGTVLARAVRNAVERKRLDREREALLRREQESRSVAEAAVRARDEVLRVVSHDLGNSLSAVGLHASLLERTRDGEGALDEVRRREGTIRQLVMQSTASGRTSWRRRASTRAASPSTRARSRRARCRATRRQPSKSWSPPARSPSPSTSPRDPHHHGRPAAGAPGARQPAGERREVHPGRG